MFLLIIHYKSNSYIHYYTIESLIYSSGGVCLHFWLCHHSLPSMQLLCIQVTIYSIILHIVYTTMIKTSQQVFKYFWIDLKFHPTMSNDPSTSTQFTSLFPYTSPHFLISTMYSTLYHHKLLPHQHLPHCITYSPTRISLHHHQLCGHQSSSGPPFSVTSGRCPSPYTPTWHLAVCTLCSSWTIL